MAKKTRKLRQPNPRRRSKAVTAPPAHEFHIDLTHDPEKYNHFSKRGAKLTYFLFLLILTVCNFLIFLLLAPLMLIIRSDFLILILAGIGLVFGMLFLYLVKDIEHLQPRHHLFAALFIPLISIVNIVVLMTLGRLVQPSSDFQNSTIVYSSAIYVAMFLLPFAIEQIFRSLFPKKK